MAKITKISEMSRDFGMKAKDVIEGFKEVKIEKNTGASVTDVEFGMTVMAEERHLLLLTADEGVLFAVKFTDIGKVNALGVYHAELPLDMDHDLGAVDVKGGKRLGDREGGVEAGLFLFPIRQHLEL